MKQQKRTWKFIPTYEIWSLSRGVLMGLAIISVILFHFFKDYMAANAEAVPVFMPLFQDYIGSAGVDLFLVLSGMGLYYSYKSKLGKENVFHFYLVKLSRVLVPYLLIAIPADLVRRVWHQGKEWTTIIDDLTFVNFFRNGENWFWYIGMISVCYLIFPILFHIVDKTTTLIEETIFLLLLIAFVTIASYFIWVYNKDLFSNINGALLRFPPFFVGIFIGKRSYERRWFNIFTILLFPLCWVWNTYLPVSSNMILHRYQMTVNILVVSYIVALIVFVAQIFPWHPIRWIFEFIGKYTLELYLTHVAVRAIMTWLGYKTDNYLWEGIMLLISVAVSVVLRLLSNLILRPLR